VSKEVTFRPVVSKWCKC